MTTPQSDLRRKAYLLAKELGLARQGRIDFSNAMLPNVPEHDSWEQLSDEQLGRVLDGLHGFVLLNYLRNQGSATAEARTSARAPRSAAES